MMAGSTSILPAARPTTIRHRLGAYRGRASILLNTRLTQAWEAEALLVSMLKRTDFMFRPKVIWSAARTGGLLSVWMSSVASPPVCSVAIRIVTGLYRGTLVLLEHRSSSSGRNMRAGCFWGFSMPMVRHVPFPGLRDVFLRSRVGLP
jgi:hypothetical protein